MSHRLLLLVGCNLALVHLCLVRELASLQYCTELLLLFLTVSFFSGQALGFVWYSRLQSRGRLFSLCWLATPLPALAAFRVAAGYLRASSQKESFYLLAFVYLTSLTAVYSAFLPQAIEADASRSRGLARAYSAELLGSLAGLGILVLLGGNQQLAMTCVYPILVVLLTLRLGYRGRELAAIVLLNGFSLSLFVVADQRSTETYYQLAFKYSEQPRLIFRENSPYQKVEVLQLGDEKLLFLNGVEFFSRGELDDFNFYLSELPARLIRPKNVLIIGSGSMSAVGRIAPFSESATTVELDEAVVRASRLHFGSEHPPEGFEHRVVIDDARRFLRETEEKFDLIILDIPTAFTLQTGTLFTRDFFRLAKTRLTGDGVLSIYLTQPWTRQLELSVAGPILSAVDREFEDMVLLRADDVSNSFVFASDALPFRRADVDRILAQEGRFEQHLFESDLARKEAAKFEPASLHDLRHVWAHQ